MPTDPVFDYVVIGAGSAGCVLANRLSADPRNRVLLLEAGGKDSSPLIHVPAGFLPMLQKGLYSWHYQTAPQAHLDNRVLPDARGKVLGGSSSINGMCYSRGAPEIFDGWAAAGNAGWSYREVLPYFRKAEGNEHGEDLYHGGSGPLSVTRAKITNPAIQAWLQAAQEAGFPYNDDHNGARSEGFGPSERTIRNGRRISTAVAYLKPARRRASLAIETHACATRLLFEGSRAVAVEYRQGEDTRRVRARREIVVSCGTYQSAQLLMLSGIGDAEHLRSVGIEPFLDLKGVGRNLHDHVGTQIQFSCPETVTDYRYARNPLLMLGAVLAYLSARKGLIGSNGTDAVAYLRSGAPGHSELDLKYYFIPILTSADAGFVREHGVTNLVILTRPESRGELRLRSPDPLAPPIIDTNYLAHERDREALRRGIGIARGIFGQKAYDRFRGREVAPGADVRSDEALEAYFRRTIGVNYEAVGTCRMGNDTDDLAKRPNSPEDQLSLVADWVVARRDWGDVIAHADVFWQDDSYATALWTGSYEIEGGAYPYIYEPIVLADRTIANFRLGIENVEMPTGRLRAALWARNLFDEEYDTFGINFGALGPITATYGEPRTYGIDLTWEF